MSVVDAKRDDILASLESALTDPSAEQKLDLKDVLSRLTELIEHGRMETAVKAVQLLGTAAGSHGKIPTQDTQEHFRDYS
jgi:hypothetical protein